MKKLIGITGVTAAMLLTTGAASAFAYSHSSTYVSTDTYNRQYTSAYGSASQCYNNGWQNLKASDGSRRFASQQQCLDYYNRSNTNHSTKRVTTTNTSSDNFRTFLSDFLQQLRNWIESLIQQLLY